MKTKTIVTQDMEYRGWSDFIRAESYLFIGYKLFLRSNLTFIVIYLKVYFCKRPINKSQLYP